MSIALEQKIVALEAHVSKQADALIVLQAHLLETRQWLLDEREKSAKALERIDVLEKALRNGQQARGGRNG